jgi:hypothetical protein
MPKRVRIDLPTPIPADLLWGVRQIAAYVGLPERRVRYLIAKSRIPTKKLGPKTIVARKSQIDRAIVGADE